MTPKTRTFEALAVNGRRLSDVDRMSIASFIAQFDGTSVDITVKAHRRKRSGAQNRRYFALLTVGAVSLWDDPSQKDYLHEEIAHLLLSLPPDEKTGLRRRMRTPDMETDEFGRYMDRVAGKLIELGADLSAWDEVERRIAA